MSWGRRQKLKPQMLVEREVVRSANGGSEEGDYSVWGDWRSTGLGWVSAQPGQEEARQASGGDLLVESGFLLEKGCVEHGSERTAGVR